MKDRKETTPLRRREFLRVAGLASGALGAAAVAGAPDAAKAAAAPDGRKTSGYRETDHVKTYYRLAR
ncbi:MAG: formate dehydrogenase [Rhodospirillales bacterium]|nr:formate dehydrogenase [Rhodospirillales bacterium]